MRDASTVVAAEAATAVPADILAFILSLGWEGPLVMLLGGYHHVLIESVAGVLMTALLWGRVGVPMLLAVLKARPRAT